jgi:hypothetical protein
MIKLRWAGHIAYMGEKKNAYCFGLKTWRDPDEGLVTEERKILKLR